MVVFLYGADGYRRGLRLRALVAAAAEKQRAAGFSPDTHDADFAADEDAWKAARDFLEQGSLFAGKKILTVRNAGECEEKAWLSALKAQIANPDAFVVLSDARAKPKKAHAFLQGDGVKAEEFAPLSGAEFAAFLRALAKRADVALSRGAEEHLARCAEGSPEAGWIAANAVAQIALAGFPQPVSAEDAARVASPAEDPDTFRAVQRLLAPGAPGPRLAALEELFSRGADEGHMFNSLAYAARGDALMKLADLDVAVKSGNADYDTALLDLALGG